MIRLGQDRPTPATDHSKSSGLHRREMEAALDGIVGEGLRPGATWLGGLYLFFAVCHLFMLPRGIAPVMAAVAFGTAGFLFGLSFWLKARPVPSGWGHRMATGIAGLVLFNILLHFHLLADPSQTTNLMLLLVGVGCSFLSGRWFALVIAAALVGWALIVSGEPPPQAWLRFGFFALVSATVLSVIVHLGRVRTFTRLEGLRLHDAAQKAELQAALAAAQSAQQADQRKDDFLAMLAHELRNPLGALSNAAQLLKRFGPEEPRLRRALETIERQVNHQAHMLDDLLDVSRITRGKIALRRQPLELVQLLCDTVEDRRGDLEAAGLTLFLNLPHQTVWIDGDGTRLAQVVSNLLQNAVKFTDPGGQVWLRLDLTPQPPSAGTRAAGDGKGEHDAPPTVASSFAGREGVQGGGAWASLSIRDTGIGVEPAMLVHVFEPFAQGDRSLDRSRGGLGLGLALVKGLVELHGGTIRAHSEGIGRGAEFTVFLPTTRASEAGETVMARSGVPTGPIRVLVVEDNRDAAQTLRDLLEWSGCTVEVAYSGPSGVDAARQFRPEVVLCDLGLPGVDGYQVAAMLRQDPGLSTARLIAVSGYGQEEDRRRSLAAGFDLHLTKPIDFDELQRLLEASRETRHR